MSCHPGALPVNFTKNSQGAAREPEIPNTLVFREISLSHSEYSLLHIMFLFVILYSLS